MVVVGRLVWDEWNLVHLRERHGLSRDQVDEVCSGSPVEVESYKQRIMLIGPDRSGQLLTMVIGPVPGEPGAYYTFSARPASRKERRLYREQRGPEPNAAR